MSARLRELLHCFKPRPVPSVCDWLRKEISLPEQMARRNPGRFSTVGRRFMEPVLECWHPDSGINQLDFAAGTQIAKTTIGCLGIAYRLHHHAWPVMIMGPAARWTEREIGQLRLIPLIDFNPTLSALKPDNPDHFTHAMLQMRTAPVVLTGANSPTAIAGFSGGIIWVEEAAKIKRIEHEESPDAHPIKNAFERSKDFRDVDYFHYMSCTPTSPVHPFWISIEEGSQTRFHVPCPHCGEWFPMDLPGPGDMEDYSKLIGKELPKDYRALQWDQSARDATGAWDKDKVAASTKYICPHNHCPISEESRMTMLDQAEQRHHNTYASKNHRSYIVPSFYSPRITYADFALEFLKTQSQLIIGMESFYNSWRATTWELIKKNLKEDVILKLKGTHQRRTIPARPALLVLTADPGDTSGTHWMVTAIMPDASLVVIDWGVLVKPEQLLANTFRASLAYPLAGTSEILRPTHAYPDCGYDTELIYSLSAASNGSMTPMKGAATRVGTWWESDVKSHPGLKRIDYCDHQAKMQLYAFSIFDRVGPAVVLPYDPYTGSAGINTAATDDPSSYAALIAGLSGQKLIDVNGEMVFKKILRDHYGDCLKQAKIVSWLAQSIITHRFDTTPPAGRTYDLRA